MKQIDFLKKLSGKDRLEQAFQLSDFVLDLARQNIKTYLGKKATPKKIQQELKKRLSYEK